MTLVRITLDSLFAAKSGLIAQERSPQEEELHFAAVEIEKACGNIIKEKKIDWRTTSRIVVAESKNVKTDQVWRKTGKGITWPKEADKTSPGIFMSERKETLYQEQLAVREVCGLIPGMELVKVNRHLATTWLANRITTSRHPLSF